MRDDDPELDAGGAAEPAEPSLGDQLRAGREALGLELEQLAAELRIELRFLRALESNELDKLGAPVFAKGYIKQIGNRLRLDYGDLLAAYYRLVGPADVTMRPSRSIRLRDEAQITAWVVAGLVLLLLIAFLAVWWMSGRTGSWLSSMESAPASAVPVAAPAERSSAS
jgi:cytoskeleton protein RodZ